MEKLSAASIKPLSSSGQNAGGEAKYEASPKVKVASSRNELPAVAEPEREEKHQLDERA
jgi:hypothetical protein